MYGKNNDTILIIYNFKTGLAGERGGLERPCLCAEIDISYLLALDQVVDSTSLAGAKAGDDAVARLDRAHIGGRGIGEDRRRCADPAPGQRQQPPASVGAALDAG